MRVEFQIANVLWTFLSAGILWLVWRRFVAPALADHLRYRLFNIRREMFLFMADGEIDPNEFAYSRVRSFMNSAIRYADGFSLMRTVVNAASVGNYGRERVRELQDAINSLPEGVREKIASFRLQASSAVAFYMIVRSPIGWALILLAFPVVLLFLLVSLVKRAWAETWSQRALARVRLRAEEETQVLRCMEEDEGIATQAKWINIAGPPAPTAQV